MLYVQPLGEFTLDQFKIVELTSEFMRLYFNLPVKNLGKLPLDVVPLNARRVLPGSGGPQILTSYILKNVLKPRLPRDGAALVAFTATDLWPSEGWNFVFGQASLSERVGVWSISRYGDPSKGDAAFRLCLLRAIATATHETGHMLSLLHCTSYECNMNGSESLEESDRQPLALCPECLAKICWATRTQPLDHLKRLADFCQKNGLKKEEAAYRRSIKALELDRISQLREDSPLHHPLSGEVGDGIPASLARPADVGVGECVGLPAEEGLEEFVGGVRFAAVIAHHEGLALQVDVLRHLPNRRGGEFPGSQQP
ncbi:MAG: hypothetical protein IPP78_00835 [Holophagaceae bacterium]|nr:hypothetical protein [Holophagaceae bacterium]